jgi:hypothetical protein
MAPALLLLLLTACTPIPAHADANNLPPGAPSPGGHPPANRAYISGAGVDYDFDPGRGPLFDARIEDDIWLDPFGGWATTTPLPVLPPPVVTGCRPAPDAVPGPLPLLGLFAAFFYSRKLRQRINGTNS